MNGWKKRWKRYAAPVWALFLAVSLILGGCGGGDGTLKSIGEEILESAAGGLNEAEEREASQLADEILESAVGDIGEEVPGLVKETLESAVGDVGENVPEQLESAAGEVKEGASELAEELLESAEGDVKEEVSELAEEFSEAVDEAEEKTPEPEKADGISVEFGEEYSDRDHVALYLHLYEELPPNYITKDEARDLGWDSGKGNLWDVAPGKSIGGDRFGNREGLLPGKKGRTYYECDIDYEGGYRGGKRIVYSSDGLVYYSEDHYENFELLYDKEGPAE